MSHKFTEFNVTILKTRHSVTKTYAVHINILLKKTVKIERKKHRKKQKIKRTETLNSTVAFRGMHTVA